MRIWRLENGIRKQAGVEGYMLDQMPWRITVDRYGQRAWGVWLNGELLVVALYKRGADQVKELLEEIQAELIMFEESVSPTAA